MTRLPVLLLFLAAVSGPVAALSASDPVPGRPILVVALPGTDVEGAVERAGARLLGPERAPLGVFAVADDPAALVRLGAERVAVLDGTWLANICGVT